MTLRLNDVELQQVHSFKCLGVNILLKLQNRMARIITGASYLTRSNDVFDQLGWSNLAEQRQYPKAIMMFQIINV